MDYNVLRNLFSLQSLDQGLIALFSVFLIGTGMASMVTGELGISIWKAFGIGRGRQPDVLVVVALSFLQSAIGFWLLTRYVSVPMPRLW